MDKEMRQMIAEKVRADECWEKYHAATARKNDSTADAAERD